MGRLLAFFGIPICAAIVAYSLVYVGVLPQGFPANVEVSRAEDVDAIMCIFERL